MTRTKRNRAYKCLRLMSQNVQSLSEDKEEELIGKIYSKNFHIICLQETWRQGAQQWSNNECTVITNGPPEGQTRVGQGVAIVLGPQATVAWTKSGQRVYRFGQRIVAVRLEFKTARKIHHLFIVSGYAPHSGYPLEIREEYQSQLRQCIETCTSYERLIIGTDTNSSIGVRSPTDLTDRVRGPYGIAHENECGRDLHQLLAMEEMCLPTTFFKAKRQHDTHTWRSFRTNKPFQIDHFIMKRKDLKKVQFARTYRWGLDSDHRAIIMQVKLHGLAMTRRKIKERLDRELLTFNPDAVTEFTESVSADMSTVNKASDGAQTRFNALQGALKSAAKKALTVDVHREPWFKLKSKQILPLVQGRDEIRYNLNRRKTKRIRIQRATQHHKAKCTLKRQLVRAKQRWVNMTVQKILNKQHRGILVSPRDAWVHIRELQRGPRATSMIHPMQLYREDKSVSTDPPECHGIMKNYLTQTFNQLRSYDAEVVNSIPRRRTHEWMDATPTLKEVIDATKKLSNGKSGGEARIPVEYYKALLENEDTECEIHNLIVAFWESGSFKPPNQTEYVPPQPPTLEVAERNNWRIEFHPFNVKNDGANPWARYEAFKHSTTIHEARQAGATTKDLTDAVNAHQVTFLYPIRDDQDLPPLPDDTGGVRFPQWESALLRLLPKKGDLSLPKNWRGICLLDVASKIASTVIVNRLGILFEEVGPQEQNGFRHKRGTIDGLFEVIMALNKRQEHDQETWVLFIDLVKAFDTVNHEALFTVLRRYGAPDHFVNLVIRLHDRASMSFSHGGVQADIGISIGVRQGSCEGPVLFLFMMLAAMETLEWDPTMTKPVFACTTKSGLTGHRPAKRAIHFDFWHSLFADDCALLFATRWDLIRGTNIINDHLKKFGLLMHVGRGEVKSKTEAMYVPSKFNSNGDTSKYTVDGDGFVEFTKVFRYLGCLVEDNLEMSTEITTRIRKASSAFGSLSKLFKDETLTLTVKGQIYSVLIVTILLYGCEVWNLTAHDEKRLRTFHRRCIRSILKTTPLEMKRTHIRTKHQEETLGVNCIIDNYRWRLLKWVGHVSRMPIDSLQRRMMTCWVDHNRPNGRPKQRWGHAVNRALKARKISTQFDTWFKLAQDEETWYDAVGPLIRKDKTRYFKKLYKARVHNQKQHDTTDNTSDNRRFANADTLSPAHTSPEAHVGGPPEPGYFDANEFNHQWMNAHFND